MRQVLVGGPDAHFVYTLIRGGNRRDRGQRVVRLQLDHGPDGHSHSSEGFFQRLELRLEGSIDAFPRLVTGPEIVAEGLDDVIGGHPHVGRPRLTQLQHGVQHAGHGAEGRILAFAEAALSVEVSEELVGPVDEMNDHCVFSPVGRLSGLGNEGER